MKEVQKERILLGLFCILGSVQIAIVLSAGRIRGAGMNQNSLPDGEIGVRVWTRMELGAVIPRDWAIEQSAGSYTAFLGGEVSLTPQRSMRAAIESIRAVLATTIKNTAEQLQESIISEQLNFFDEVKRQASGGEPLRTSSAELDPKLN